MVDVNTENLRGADDVFLSKADMASRLNVTERTLENWMRKRLVPFHRIGRTVRFDLREVRTALAARRIDAQQSKVCLQPAVGAAETLRQAAQEIRNRRRRMKGV
jgi:excisionase family DNA binding protein